MKTKPCCLMSAIVLLISVLPALVCLADDRARDRSSLRGIKTVVVKVHSFEREWAARFANVGLTESVLQAAIERQLENSGMSMGGWISIPERGHFIRP